MSTQICREEIMDKDVKLSTISELFGAPTQNLGATGLREGAK